MQFQWAALHEAGCRRIFDGKVSGAKRDRPELARLLDQLCDDHVLVVTRLGRPDRSRRNLLDVAEIPNAAGPGLRSFGDPWADTTIPQGRVVLTTLGCAAELAREHDP